MISNRHITKIVAVFMTAAVLACLLVQIFYGNLTVTTANMGTVMEYQSALFQTDQVIQINIEMEEEEWQEMLKDAISETYRQCDIEINGTKLYNVGIRPKGNTSLSSIAEDPDTDRYSFKLEFDRFAEGQTCFGLDKIILNNNYADATNMKEAIVYDMYRYLDTDASLYNYAKVSINGEYWGVYLALEAVEDSFMLRNYGTESGKLYKPDNMDMGQKDEKMSGMPQQPQEGRGMSGKQRAAGEMSERSRADGEKSGMKGSRNGGGADLNYVDNDTDSYSTIWDGAVTDTSETDHRKVVTALKNISEGNEIESYLDVDNILKYMAVHTFAVNLDSLTGSMAHNYYLYESDGKLNILPWDYNLSFGGMTQGSRGGASEVVNFPIDTPFSGTEFFDAFLANENYLAQYHAYLKQLVDEYVCKGIFDQTYYRICSQIDGLVKTDLTAFYSYEEYESAKEMLYQTIKFRAESIQGQLDGQIPTTSEGQKEDTSSLVDAESIQLEVMGTMNMEKERNAFSKGQPENSEKNVPGERFFGAQAESRTGNRIFYAACFVVLAAACVCTALYRRKPYQKTKKDYDYI